MHVSTVESSNIARPFMLRTLSWQPILPYLTVSIIISSAVRKYR